MAAFCVLVKGHCRGKMCDFWVRVRLEKLHIEELAQDLRNSITGCDYGSISALNYAFSKYWSDFGIKDLRRLCEEEPELCSKMKHIEDRIRKTMF
jgi:hypothetical protein